MTKKEFKIKQIGIKKSFFQDLYYNILKTSWFNFFISAAIFYLLLNFIFAILYFFSPAEILNVKSDSIWDAFVFSFQTSSTLGYGYFVPKSPSAHAIVMLDTIIGIFYVAIITGLAFAKFARPSANILFSNKIIYTTFDNIPTIMFRLANNRNTHIVDASLNVAVLLPYTSNEGHSLRRFYKIALLSNDNPTFSLSWTAIHQMDEKSPLHGMSLEQLKEQNALITVSFTGIDHVISQSIHSNHRYTCDQIIEAKQFVDILKFEGDSSYSLDFNHFHDVQ